MNAVFADTSFFVAYLNARDEYHAEAKGWIRTHAGGFITTPWVILEVANFFSGSKAREDVGHFLSALLRDRRFEVLSADAQDLESGLSLYTSRPDKRWSLTDCISFNVLTALKLRRVLTSDHHFEQAGFETLLKAKS